MMQMDRFGSIYNHDGVIVPHVVVNVEPKLTLIGMGVIRHMFEDVRSVDGDMVDMGELTRRFGFNFARTVVEEVGCEF